MPLDLPPSNDIQLEVNNVDILEEYRARATSFAERITKMFGDDTEKWPESIRLMYYEPKEGVHRMFQAYNEAIKEFDRIENELGQVENGASQIHQTIGELKVRIAELSDPEAELENNDDYKNGQIAYAQEVRKKLEIELEDADLLAMLKSQNKDIVHEQSLRRAKDTLQKEVTELETKLGGADKLSDNLKDQEKAVEEVLSVVQGSIDRFFLKAEMEKSALEKMKAADEQYTTLRLQTELEQIDR